MAASYQAIVLLFCLFYFVIYILSIVCFVIKYKYNFIREMWCLLVIYIDIFFRHNQLMKDYLIDYIRHDMPLNLQTDVQRSISDYSW